MSCGKESGHFDGGSFGMGIGIGVGATILFISFFMSSANPHGIIPHREAELSKGCAVGEQVLMTSAPTVELYICEPHWVRR